MIPEAFITTDSSSNATVYLSLAGQQATPLTPLGGLWAVESVSYVKNDFSDGVDFAITEHETGMKIWSGTNVNASTTFYPRAFIGDPATGTVSTTVYDSVVIGGQIRIGISSGGTNKTGRFVFRLSPRAA